MHLPSLIPHPSAYMYLAAARSTKEKRLRRASTETGSLIRPAYLPPTQGSQEETNRRRMVAGLARPSTCLSVHLLSHASLPIFSHRPCSSPSPLTALPATLPHYLLHNCLPGDRHSTVRLHLTPRSTFFAQLKSTVARPSVNNRTERACSLKSRPSLTL